MTSVRVLLWYKPPGLGTVMPLDGVSGTPLHGDGCCVCAN